MKIYTADRIKNSISLERDLPDLLKAQQEAFMAFSQGRIHVPAPLQLSFQDPPGDCHVKAGFGEGDEVFVVKIATGFPHNTALGLPAGDGALLVFSQATGLLQAILCDEGYLTLLRTALAAYVAAQLTPFPIQNIGIVGTGSLGVMVLQVMRYAYPEAKIRMWGRNFAKARQRVQGASQATAIEAIPHLLEKSDLMVTTTPSTEPLLCSADLPTQMHIVALGADGPPKQELAPDVFARADLIFVDSQTQTTQLGDVSYALQAGVVEQARIEELGTVLLKDNPLRLANGIIVTDLTGIAAQDIAIAQGALTKLGEAYDG